MTGPVPASQYVASAFALAESNANSSGHTTVRTVVVSCRASLFEGGCGQGVTLLSLTDPVGNVTSWQYDDLGRVTTETIALDSQPVTRSYAYDLLGRLLEYVDRNGRVTEYAYDDLDRLTAEKWYLAEQLAATIALEYDEFGQLLSAVDSTSGAEHLFDYDDLGRVTLATFNHAGRETEFAYDYDPATGWLGSERREAPSRIAPSGRRQPRFRNGAMGRRASVGECCRRGGPYANAERWRG